MTTKQQEREILSQIAALIESAGEDSYIGAAFTGCVALARDNIDNDFCQNFPDRLDRLTHDYGVLSKSVDNMADEIRKLKQERAQLDADLKAAIQKQLPADLYSDLWLTISQQEQDAADSMMQIASTLADLAGCPNDIAVKHGLNAMQTAKAKRDNAAALLERLEKYE